MDGKQKMISKNKNIKNIIFYNHFHKGDIFLSREFIKDIINKLNLNFYYLHGNDGNFFNDLNIKSIIDVNQLKNINHWNCPFIIDETLYLNTWYNACNGRYMEGCILQTFYNIFKEYYKILNIELDIIQNYIPSVDYSKFNIDKAFNLFDNSIMICNNTPLSGQSNIRNMDVIIDGLSKKFTNKILLVTNETNLNNKNIIKTNIVTKNNTLFEISYLSKFCNYIIGRSSGPYSFSLIKENIFNNKLKYISICSSEDLVDFGLKKFTHKNKFNYINSNLNDDEILNLLIQYLNDE